MSDSSDSSVPEVRRRRTRGNSKKDEKSPKKMQRSALFMCIDVSEKELKYRKKNFQDEKEVVSSNKICCTACGSDLKHLIRDGREVFCHPVLKVLMCKSCVEFYGDGSFSPDEDGTDRFCRWCAQGGTLYCCAECTCAFCKKCIYRNFKRSILDDIEDEDWKCFVCNVKPLWELRAICAAAQSCANEVRRNKRKEVAENLKELQKKMPEKPQNRRSNRWQQSKTEDAVGTSAGKKRKRNKSTSSESEPVSTDHEVKKQKRRRTADNEEVIHIDSSDDEAERSKLKSSQTKKQLKEKKRYTRESDSDDTSKRAKLRKKETVGLQKQNKEKLKDKSLKDVEENSSTKGNVSASSKPKRLLKNGSSVADENSCLPEKTDRDTAQWFCHWLKDLGQDIIDQSNLCSNNVTKFLEKKVTVEKMIYTKTAEKTINMLQTLIDLTSENIERAKGLLTLNHKYWKSRVIKLSKELQDDDDDSDEKPLKNGKESTHEKCSKELQDDDDDDDSDDKQLTNREEPTQEKRRLRQRKETTKNLSEVSSDESELERTVIKKKSKCKKKKTDSVAEISQQKATSKQSSSDSDETHLSGADNKVNCNQESSKKVESDSKPQNEEVEGSASKDSLCNGIDEVSQDHSSASDSEDCTLSEGLAAKLCKEKLKKEVSKESKKNLEDEKNAESQESDGSKSSEDVKNVKTSSSSKKESENIKNADESMETDEKEVKQNDTTLQEAANSSSEEMSAAEEDNLKDTSEDIFDATTQELTQEQNKKNNKKSTNSENTGESGNIKKDKPSDESDKVDSNDEDKGKMSKEDNDDQESVASTETLECLYSNEQETSPKDVKMKVNSQTTEKENTSDIESSLKSYTIEIKEEKIVSSQEAKLLEKMDLSEETVDKEEEEEDSVKDDNSKADNKTAQNSDSDIAEDKNSTASSKEKNGNNEEELPSKEKSEEQSKYTEGGCKAQQSLLGYSSDDENGREENEEDSDSVKDKKKKRKKGKLVGITGTSTPLKKTGTKSKRSKKGDDLLPSDIDSEDSEEEEEEVNLQNRKVKSKIKAKEEDGKKAEATKETEQQDSSDSSGKEDTTEKKQAKDKDIKSLINMKTLRKKGRKASDDSEDAADTDTDNEKDKRKRAKRKKKEAEIAETLMDFFNKNTEDEDDDDDSDSDDILKSMRQKSKDLWNKQNDLAKKMMMENSSSDNGDNDGEEDDEIIKKPIKKENEKVKEEITVKVEKMKVDKTEATSEEEKGPEPEPASEPAPATNDEDDDEVEVIQVKDKVNEVYEISSDKEDDDSDSDHTKDKKKGKSWRRDKLLTMKLADTDTSDEEERWKAKKNRIKEESSNDSEDESKTIRMPKKSNRRRAVASDDDTEVLSSDTSSSSIFERSKSKKSRKNTKKSGSEKSSDSDSDIPKRPKKAARKRIKTQNSSSSNDSSENELDTSQKGDSQSKGRKNIRKVMKDESVGEATRRAAREEEERKKRILEKQMLYNEIFKEKGVETIDKLVLDFDPETKKELVAVHPSLVSKLKPHQVQGVKFMWESCFESLKQVKKTKGSGCILAHCMGLGKTLQVVALLHTLLTHKATKIHTAMVVCPLSTVQNWVNEFNIWLKDIEDAPDVNVYELSRYKQNYERMYQLNDWQEEGGVLVLGYDMYRNLSNPTGKRLRKKVIESFQRTLVDPGPDIVVCDEGHLLKNEDTALSKAMRRIKTLRRIVLTGTPLQNNLKEYHCMVQFVKPNLLGTRKEFLNRFVNPITNGQFEDSTAHDVKVMKRRAHVLHKMLEGSVQRFDYAVLTPFLPPKYEYVIAIRLTETQIKIYRHYLDNYSMRGEKGKGAKLFSDFQNLQRIWTHPRVLQMSADKAEKIAEKKRLMESDSEGSLRDFIDDSDDSTSEVEEKTVTEVTDSDSDIQVLGKDEDNVKPKKSKCTRNTRSKGLDAAGEDNSEKEKEDDNEIIEETPKAGEWWKQFIQGHEMEDLRESGKLVLLFTILQECEKIGDKVLLFSQSLYSLDLIEYFLERIDAATQEGKPEENLAGHTGSWSIGLDYFRLDGSTPGETRNTWCKAFNREDNTRARLFLISTRAGGLGINLYAANRVIIFDASWNPSHDVQSIFRVYRFGQKKPCYIYRFLAQGTMEEKIYDRQVTKLSLSCRVVDEQQIERYYKMADLQELYQFDPEQKTKRPTPILPKDRLLAELLKEHEQWIDNYHEHDSLLENVQEEELNEEERKAAWEEYENEKKGKINVAGFGYLNNMGFMGQMPNTNVPALREALKKQNPTATDEQIENQLRTVLNQLRMYLNNMQASTSVPNQNFAAYPQMNQMNQNYQTAYIQQQQQTYQRMLQQQQQYAAGMNWNQNFPQYGQNLQEGQQAPFATGMYRDMVPTNPLLEALLKSNITQKSNQVSGPGDTLISREPIVLPVNKTLQMHRKLVPLNPPVAHSSSRYFPTKGVAGPASEANKKKTGNTKTFSNEDIETID